MNKPILVSQSRRQRSKGARSFRGQNILEPGYPDALFSSKNLTFSGSSPSKHKGRQRRRDCFTVNIKQIKRSDIVKFLFSVHTITEAKQSNKQGGARSGAREVDLPARSLTWRALA